MQPTLQPSSKTDPRTWVRALASHLGRGLKIILPIGVTLWILSWVFALLDKLLPIGRWLGWNASGLGILALLALAVLVGYLAPHPWIVRLARRAETLLLRIPVMKLVYSTARDFVEAFFGKKRFDKPVLVKLGGFDAEVIGFITRENLEAFGVLDKVAVYFPQSYNIGGNVLILPRERLTPVPAVSALVMSFVVTGGVASIEPAACLPPAAHPAPASHPLECPTSS